MIQEVLAEIQRRSAEQKRMIASGEIKVCDAKNPMPEGSDQIAQKWYPAMAVPASEIRTGANGRKERDYKCPVCGSQFVVEFNPIIVKELPNAIV